MLDNMIFLKNIFIFNIWNQNSYGPALLGLGSRFFLFEKKITEFFITDLRIFNYYFALFALNNLNNFFSKSALYTRWFKCIIIAGTGYQIGKNRRRMLSRHIRCSFGTRIMWEHNLNSAQFFFRKRYRTLFLFSTSKIELAKLFKFFYLVRKPFVYKVKGAVANGFRRKKTVFLRKLKMRKIKVKLTKKQKFI